LAHNERSSKSFRDEGAWARVLPEKPDFVLIQFGDNDGPTRADVPRLLAGCVDMGRRAHDSAV